jgi:beta-phosphoglucomutase-like phosphatase (HAD superfamily)
MSASPAWPRALLFDVDGTLAETERDGHLPAFNSAFEAMGLPWRWDEARYGELLHVSGGRERLLHDMASRADAPPEAGRDALARALHQRKNAIYAGLVEGGAVALRGGVKALWKECGERGVPMGITTTTSRSNLDALLRAQVGAHWADLFAVVLCGEDVALKKPDPEVYRRAVQALGLLPQDALALEDSPAGVAAACGAGVPVVVTRSVFFATAELGDALAVGPGLDTRSGWQPPLATGSGTEAATAPVGLDDFAGWLAAR